MVIQRKGARIPTLPSHETLVQRLMAHYNDADETTLRLGRTWYDTAGRFAETLAERYGYHVSQTAYVIAALSPNVAWRDNMVTAENACRSHRAGESWFNYRGAGYGRNKAKCEAILNGSLEALNGPKVTRFAEAILGNPDSCTVDIWMMRAGGFDHDNPSPAEGRALRLALATVAERTGETVRDVQAIIWVQVRDNRKGQIRLFHEEAA